LSLLPTVPDFLLILVAWECTLANLQLSINNLQNGKMKIYKITGMDCPSCAALLELDLEDAGCRAKCSYAKGTLEVEEPHDPKKIVEIIKKSGYSVLPD